MEQRLISYLYYFNVAQDYFECHEVGESLWLDTGRPVILKGLIQAAVCLYHLQNGNIRGGYSMWLRAREYLDPYLPIYEYIDLVHLIEDIDRVFQRIPDAWLYQVVSPEAVSALGLPTVSVQVTDVAIAEAIHNFSVSEL